ncbi:MAG: hypothetical protein IT190_07395 [Microbacteriaceae bacterium]|nr:hypothetical protein [Microbacteriaceae bacterium]
MVSQSFKNDLNAARKAQREDAKQFVVVRLTKAGVPSKMADDTKRFGTEEIAIEYITRIRALNPKSTFRFTLNGEEK